MDVIGIVADGGAVRSKKSSPSCTWSLAQKEYFIDLMRPYYSRLYHADGHAQISTESWKKIYKTLITRYPEFSVYTVRKLRCRWSDMVYKTRRMLEGHGRAGKVGPDGLVAPLEDWAAKLARHILDPTAHVSYNQNTNLDAVIEHPVPTNSDPVPVPVNYLHDTLSQSLVANDERDELMMDNAHDWMPQTQSHSASDTSPIQFASSPSIVDPPKPVTEYRVGVNAQNALTDGQMHVNVTHDATGDVHNQNDRRTELELDKLRAEIRRNESEADYWDAKAELCRQKIIKARRKAQMLRNNAHR